jgi:DNA-binding protein H-NS
MATLAQLENQIQKLQRRAEALRARKTADVVANIRALMQEHGLTAADIETNGSGSLKRRGRPAGSTAGSMNGHKSTKKAAVKSKLPAKYRDPVSGMTWSGHARPPAWIKDAPDRDAFLIRKSAANGATQKSAKRGGAPAAKKAGRKRVAKAEQSASA